MVNPPRCNLSRFHKASAKAILPRVRSFMKGAYGIKVDQSGRRETF